jgi:Protein of unknown function (DUF2442)
MESKELIPKVIKAKASLDYMVEIWFEDGKYKKIDVKPFIKNGVSSALKNPNYFEKVLVENGYITWENGFDFCPEFLYNL